MNRQRKFIDQGPDATVVTTTIGVYLVDSIQQIQFILLANCRDETSTRFAVQRPLDWLNRSCSREEIQFRLVTDATTVAPKTPGDLRRRQILVARGSILMCGQELLPFLLGQGSSGNLASPPDPAYGVEIPQRDQAACTEPDLVMPEDPLFAAHQPGAPCLLRV